MKKNRLGSAEVGSCICYGLMALLQVGWLAVLLTAQLVPPVWVTLIVYCVALALFLLGQTLRVVQLRRDNADGSIYNLVGFQTHLKWPEQKRVFSMIPALKHAEFLRYGVMHRNTYLNSPKLLDRYYRVKGDERLMFAGQMTGVEGYVESTASGCLAALELARRIEGKPPIDFPQETAIGALALYISHEGVENFQPMNVNFGIMPPLGYRVKGKRNKNAALSQRALEALDGLDWR